jgi:CO/xanthine dehydrogenase Mo-binding subunit
MIDARPNADMDPIALSIKNFAHAWGACPDQSLVTVLETGAQRIGWAEKRHKPGAGALLEGVKQRGEGFSLHPGWHAEWQEERRGQVQAKITLYPDGTVTLDAPTVETGTGSNTCNVLGCAEAVKLPVRPPEETSPGSPRLTPMRACATVCRPTVRWPSCNREVMAMWPRS